MNERNHEQTYAGIDEEAIPASVSNNSVLSPQSSVLKLLAVDCGLKTGLALYTFDGQLLWYRSHNLGTKQRLKKAAWQILKEIDGLTKMVIEGGGDLAEVWVRVGEKRGLEVTLVPAEQWRKDLLLPRQQRSGKQAKQVADELAREIIDRSKAAKPKSLQHDTAEAILVGWWHLNRTL